MAANCFIVTTKSVSGFTSQVSLMINKSRCSDLVGQDSDNDTLIKYKKNEFNSGGIPMLVDDSLSTVQSALGAQYSYGKKFETDVISKGSIAYTSPQKQDFSVDSIVWAQNDPIDPTTSIMSYFDETQGLTQYKLNVDIAGLVALTTT